MSDLTKRLRDIDHADDAITKLEAADRIDKLERDLKSYAAMTGLKPEAAREIVATRGWVY